MDSDWLTSFPEAAQVGHEQGWHDRCRLVSTSYPHPTDPGDLTYTPWFARSKGHDAVSVKYPWQSEYHNATPGELRVSNVILRLVTLPWDLFTFPFWLFDRMLRKMGVRPEMTELYSASPVKTATHMLVHRAIELGPVHIGSDGIVETTSIQLHAQAMRDIRKCCGRYTMVKYKDGRCFGVQCKTSPQGGYVINAVPKECVNP